MREFRKASRVPSIHFPGKRQPSDSSPHSFPAHHSQCRSVVPSLPSTPLDGRLTFSPFASITVLISPTLSEHPFRVQSAASWRRLWTFLSHAFSADITFYPVRPTIPLFITLLFLFIWMLVAHLAVLMAQNAFFLPLTRPPTFRGRHTSHSDDVLLERVFAFSFFLPPLQMTASCPFCPRSAAAAVQRAPNR